ncbi:hypothetical protein, partial [Pseudochrobactrum sp. AO18b]|uniref:hypothetical protein n=1 Tax=Pseudochrobactrum sp. AO18b TaxID=1201036 RepID=UPI00048923F1
MASDEFFNNSPKSEREYLSKQMNEARPVFNVFVKETPSDITSGSWDLVSYSYQLGFEAMWDAARLNPSGLLTRPLLMLWRQSIELALKSAIIAVAGTNCPALKHGHKLPKLFSGYVEALNAKAIIVEDELGSVAKNIVVKESPSFSAVKRSDLVDSGRA